MDLRSLVTWNENPPEFILTGLWYAEFLDSPTNSVLSNSYFNNVDLYIKEIGIPLMEYSYKKTDFDLMTFEEKSNFDSVTITFRDDIEGSLLRYSQDWINSIYDIKKRAVKKRWRYEKKDIHAVQIRILKKSQGLKQDFLRSTFSSVLGNIKSIGGALGLTDYADVNNIEVKSVAEYMIKGCLPLGLDGVTLEEDANGDPQEFVLNLSCEEVLPIWGKDSNINISK